MLNPSQPSEADRLYTAINARITSLNSTLKQLQADTKAMRITGTTKIFMPQKRLETAQTVCHFLADQYSILATDYDHYRDALRKEF